MDNDKLKRLVDRAGKMATLNMWGETAYKINMAILRIDGNNAAACTRLAKYYKLNDNIQEAKNYFGNKLDFYVEDASVNLISSPSTVIKIDSEGKVEIVRQGIVKIT